MKMKKATRNKKERDRELSEAKTKEMVISTSHVIEKNMSDKKNKLKKKKRNRENNEDAVHEDVTHDKGGDYSDQQNDLDSLKKKKKVSRNKKRKNTETPEEAEITEIAVCPSPDDVNMSEKKKGKLKKKKNNKQKRKKDENLLHSNEVGANSNQQIVKSERKCHATSVDDEDGVYEISSGDEDETTGIKRWIGEYHESRPGAHVLLQRINDFLVDYWAQKEKERKERESEAAEGGWTVVTHMKGRKKTTDAESGTTVGSVAQAVVVDKMSKKKDKQIGLNFYRFQKREAQRNEIMMLQSKFEQDKKRIQQMRAARKFRPY